MRCSIRNDRGQATIEAAIVFPLLLVVFGVLLQPCFLLYDLCVMRSAAAETCRVASTSSCDERALKAFALHRLSAIPNANPFHDPALEYEIEIEGSSSGLAQVRIKNRLRPLPLLGMVAGLLAQRKQDGSFELEVHASSGVLPDWAIETGGDASSWISKWD